MQANISVFPHLSCCHQLILYRWICHSYRHGGINSHHYWLSKACTEKSVSTCNGEAEESPSPAASGTVALFSYSIKGWHFVMLRLEIGSKTCLSNKFVNHNIEMWAIILTCRMGMVCVSYVLRIIISSASSHLYCIINVWIHTNTVPLLGRL